VDHGEYLAPMALLQNFQSCHALHSDPFKLRLRVNYGVEKENHEKAKSQKLIVVLSTVARKTAPLNFPRAQLNLTRRRDSNPRA
jgi:hypothetical protein